MDWAHGTGLRLGGFDFLSDLPNECAVEVFAIADDDMDFGNAEPELSVMSSFLADGDVEKIDRFGNVDAAVVVELTGPTLNHIALTEALLHRELFKRNELVWTPPWGAEPSVFEVVTSWDEFRFDDFDEARRQPRRTFVVRMRRAPWARSVDEVVVEAIGSGTPTPPPDPNPVVLNAGTSLAGWTGSWGTQLSSGGWAMTLNAGYAFGNPVTWLNYTTSSPWNLTGKLLSMDWGTGRGIAGRPPTAFKVNGATVPVIAQGPVPGAPGQTRSWLDLSPLSPVQRAAVTTVRAEYAHGSTFPTNGASMWSGGIRRWDALPPGDADGKILSRSLTVHGAVRTEPTITVEHEEPLGETLIYTASESDGYEPSMHGHRINGATPTIDSTALTGSAYTLGGGTPETYLAPVTALPAGDYQIVARLKATTAGAKALSWETDSTLYHGTNLPMGAPQNGTARPAVATTWGFHNLGITPLPTIALGEAGGILLKVAGPTGVQLDCVLVYNLSTGALTWVTGNDHDRVRITPPTLDEPNPSVWVDYASTYEGMSHHVYGDNLRSMGRHLLTPGKAFIHTVTTNAANAAASMRMHRRHPHNVPPLVVES